MSKRVVLLGALLSCCAPPPLSVTATPPAYIDIAFPTVGEIAIAQVGEAVITTAHTLSAPAIRFIDPCIISEQDNQPGTAPIDYRVTGGVIFLRENTTNGVAGYCGHVEQLSPLGRYVPMRHCVAANDQTLAAFPDSETVVQSNCRVAQQTFEIDATGSIRKELFYGGRSGTMVRLFYREFSGDMARAAFSQELSYDIRDDRVIGFRGARLEVIDASNTSIRYRVLNGF
jgi:hypothetical protein